MNFFSFGKSNFKYRLHVLFRHGKTGRLGQSYLGKKKEVILSRLEIGRVNWVGSGQLVLFM